MKQKTLGFTLIEVMIVVAIMGLIAAIVVPVIYESAKAKEPKETEPASINNDNLIKQYKVTKLFELNRYDVYIFVYRGSHQVISIPIEDSVYDLEKREKRKD